MAPERNLPIPPDQEGKSFYTIKDVAEQTPHLKPHSVATMVSKKIKRDSSLVHHRAGKGRSFYFTPEAFGKLIGDLSARRVRRGGMQRLLDILTEAQQEARFLTLDEIASLLYPGDSNAHDKTYTVISNLRQQLEKTSPGSEIISQSVYGLRKKNPEKPAVKQSGELTPQPPDGKPAALPMAARRGTVWQSPFSSGDKKNSDLHNGRERQILEDRRKRLKIDTARIVLSQIYKGLHRGHPSPDKDVREMLSVSLPDKTDLVEIISGKKGCCNEEDLKAFLIKSVTEALDNFPGRKFMPDLPKEMELARLCTTILAKFNKEQILFSIREHFGIQSTSSPGPQSPEGLSHS